MNIRHSNDIMFVLFAFEETNLKSEISSALVLTIVCLSRFLLSVAVSYTYRSPANVPVVFFCVCSIVTPLALSLVIFW